MDNKIHSTHLEHLAREIKKSKAVLFVGAGMSLNADPIIVDEQEKFLLWTPMSKKFQDELKGDYSNISPPKIIQLYEDQFNISERNRVIESGVPDKKYNPGSLHKDLLDLEKFPWEAIVTTNIDSLIERTLDEKGITYTRVVKPEDFASIKGIPIYKIHGTMDEPDTYTFSEKEYLEFGIKKPLFVSKLEQLFAESTFVFFGYSLSDPDLLEIQNRIHHRLGKFQRFSFLFSRSEDAVWNEYWKKKNVLLFNQNIIATYSEKRINTPKEFIEVSLEILYDKVKGLNIDTIKKTGEYLWRQNELRPALEERTNFKELQEVVSKFSSEYFGRISTTLEKEKLMEDNGLLILDKLHEVVKRATDESELKLVFRESLEEIFQIGDGFDKIRNSYILIIVFLAKKKNLSKDTLDKLEFCIQNFLFCIQKRIELGLGIGLDIDFILRQMKYLRKQSEQKKLRNYYMQAFSYLHISGFGIKEEKVLRILKKLETIFPEDNEHKLYISYRKAIAFVYLSKWKELRNFIEVALIVKNKKWNPLWTAFLWFELGEVQKANDIYDSVIKSNTESLQKKYTAYQAIYYLTNFSSFEKLIENRKLHYDLQQSLHKLELRASKENILLKDLNFYKEEIDSFIRKMQGYAIEEEYFRKNKTIMRAGGGYSIDFIHKTYERLWNLGIPSIPFAYSEIQKAVPSIFGDIKYLASLLEISMLVPIIDDWKNFGLQEKFRTIVWNQPLSWKTLQRRIWTVYRNTLDYAIEHSFDKGNSGSNESRMKERLRIAIELIGIALPWFDKKTFSELFTHTLTFIDKLDNRFSNNRFDIGKLSNLIYSIFYQSNDLQKRKIFHSFPPEFWSSYEGIHLFEDIKEKLPEKFWMRLKRAYKLELIKVESEGCLVLLMHLAFQIKNSETEKEFKKLKGVIDRKLDAYRKDRIETFKKNIGEYSKLPESYLHMRDDTQKRLDEFERKQDRISLLYSELILDSPADNLDYPDLIVKLKSLGSSAISSADLRILNLFSKMNLTNEQLAEIKAEINRYVLLPKVKQSLKIDGSSFSRGEIIGYTSSFYLKFNLFDEWFTLQENYGYGLTYFPADNNLKSMRLLFESDVNKDFAFRFLNLFYTSQTLKQDDLLYLVYWYLKEANQLYPQDWLLLDYIWNSEMLAKYNHIVLLISIIALKLDKQGFSKKVNLYLQRLTIVESKIQINPYGAKRLLEFIQLLRSSQVDITKFQELINRIENKIQILDFEFNGS